MGRICIPAKCATRLERVVEFSRMRRFGVETGAISCFQRVRILGSLKVVGE